MQNLEKYGNRLKELRKSRNLSMDKLAEKLNTSRGQIYQLENGLRKLTTDWIDRLAVALNYPPEAFISGESSPKIPVLGTVGAGGVIMPIDDLPMISPLQLSEHEYETLNCEFVEAPPGVSPSNIACVVVKGDSMYPVYKDGEYLFYKRTPRACSDSIGLDCVVALEDGRVMVKTVRRGASYDTYTLDSYNQPPINDVRLKWCAPVEWTHKKV